MLWNNYKKIFTQTATFFLLKLQVRAICQDDFYRTPVRNKAVLAVQSTAKLTLYLLFTRGVLIQLNQLVFPLNWLLSAEKSACYGYLTCSTRIKRGCAWLRVQFVNYVRNTVLFKAIDYHSSFYKATKWINGACMLPDTSLHSRCHGLSRSILIQICLT